MDFILKKIQANLWSFLFEFRDLEFQEINWAGLS